MSAQSPVLGGDAIIGYSGFVGGTLDRAYDFAARFNSSNIHEMANRDFRMVVCAGVAAEKWRANSDPAADAAGIKRLTDVLEHVTAEEFILISTIDIYADPVAGGDEETGNSTPPQHAYGRHRHALEIWCRDRFPVCRVVRLPALFGTGLRKNALYDLLHNNQTEKLNPAGRFQWYGLARLWSDIMLMRRLDLRVVNLFPEPIELATIIAANFANANVGPMLLPAPTYNVGTKHAAAFGGAGHYIADSAQILVQIADFIAASRDGKL